MYVIIAGGGKVGFHLAQELLNANHEVLVIERDANRCRQITDEIGENVLNGDGWAYLKGELGGNSWSIQRVGGGHDVATYRDLRLILGYETLVTPGVAAQFEAGWVFSRKLMYDSSTPDLTPRDTFLIRAGLNF